MGTQENGRSNAAIVKRWMESGRGAKHPRAGFTFACARNLSTALRCVFARGRARCIVDPKDKPFPYIFYFLLGGEAAAPPVYAAGAFATAPTAPAHDSHRLPRESHPIQPARQHVILHNSFITLHVLLLFTSCPRLARAQDDILRRAVALHNGKNWKKIGARIPVCFVPPHLVQKKSLYSHSPATPLVSAPRFHS